MCIARLERSKQALSLIVWGLGKKKKKKKLKLCNMLHTLIEENAGGYGNIEGDTISYQRSQVGLFGEDDIWIYF